MDPNRLILSLIETFLAFYGVDKIEDIIIEKQFIYGKAIWFKEPADDNSQYFRYNRECIKGEEIEETTSILKFILEKKLHSNDKIIIPENALIEMLADNGWNTSNTKILLNKIYHLSIDMIDEQGKKEDIFFLHY